MQDDEFQPSQEDLKSAEPASVVGLDYIIADDQATWMRLRLSLTDQASPHCGREFFADLPPPDKGYADFVILRQRWDTAMQDKWRCGDTCKVGHKIHE